MRRALCSLAVLLALMGGVATAGTFEEDCAAARRGRLEALVGLADWCNDNQLYATRNRLSEQILAIDPTHVSSHRRLKHRLVAGGAWEAPERPPPATDRDVEALARLPEERARRMGGIAQALLAALDDHAETVSPGDREGILGEVLELTPDDQRVRREHHEVRTADGWVLLETLAGVERRMELRLAARNALADVSEPRKIDVPDAARRAGLRWRGAWATPHVRVVAATGESEARVVARTVEAAPAYLRVALGDSQDVIAGLTLFLVQQRSEAQAVFESHPDSDPETRRNWSLFSGHWIGKTSNYVAYHPGADWRLESCTSQQVSWDLVRRFRVGAERAACLAVGFDKRLVWDLVGTRITYTRRIAEYADQDVPWASWGDLTDADWYTRAREVLAGCGPADLMEIFGRPLNLVTLRDEVVANAVAAYYLEGRPDECTALLTALGSGTNANEAFQRASGLDVAALRLRLTRWLGERR